MIDIETINKQSPKNENLSKNEVNVWPFITKWNNKTV